MRQSLFTIIACMILLIACRKEDPCIDTPGVYIDFEPKYFVGDTIHLSPNNNTTVHWDSHGSGIFVETGTTTCDAASPHLILVSGNNVIEATVTNDCGTGSNSVNVVAEPHYPGTWTQKANMSLSRSNSISFSIGTKGYVTAGSGDNSIELNDHWEWDQSTDTWTQKANLPVARVDGFAFTLNGKGYVGTGQSTSGLLKDFWEYDPMTNLWTQKADYPDERHDVIAFAIGNYGYAGGGDSFQGNYTQSFYRYDPVADMWTFRAQLPSPKARSASFAINGKGYIVGGFSQPWIACNEVWEYDTAANSWTQKAAFEKEIYGYTGFTINNRGYITCGANYGSAISQSYSVYEYDPGSDTWQHKHGFPGGPHGGFSACVIGSSAYLGGGLGEDGYTNEFWEFTP